MAGSVARMGILSFLRDRPAVANREMIVGGCDA
jgi:hypothetical protein